METAGESVEVSTVPDSGNGSGKAGKSRGKGEKSAGSKQANVDPAETTDEVDVASFWKKGFVPLDEKQMQELECERGKGALQDYLDLRCGAGFPPMFTPSPFPPTPTLVHCSPVHRSHPRSTRTITEFTDYPDFSVVPVLSLFDTSEIAASAFSRRKNTKTCGSNAKQLPPRAFRLERQQQRKPRRVLRNRRREQHPHRQTK